MNPRVKTIFKIPNSSFELHILAFRKVSQNEASFVAKNWLRQSKLKSFPKIGKVTIVTIYGFDE